ncbi:MAG: class III extradiol dioxygenase family protein [Hydrogenophaga sp.]|jgi:protocatechuate 4,5-dioxygenase beta chain|uniref:class III extradiol dioxygenase family protein n=1 Tax=Hydrogenophaga sp. TaxID=1904254 RepID=UPI001D6CA473|nr:class III extradiol dioxygenase family protein [Hydrogenophaga sp.]MBW0171977.1 protocatechuate 3,4-dioxygenase [Hydrogenophaga sp.]MBW0185177.1 protocatechuate 3,4-dioxygenase [Hydrogenophaga sp.]
MGGKIIAGIGTSHVPSIGGAYDRGRTQTPAWKPLFDAYVPVREWLQDIKPDVAIMVYNDHGADFFFDKYPTFAVGCADRYAIADEGFGTRPLPAIPGDLAFSQHLCRALVYDEFDITVCQKMAVEHGFLVPMHLCFDHDKGTWPVASVPIAVNVLQHPLPTARRCFRLGQAIRRAVESYEDRDLRVAIIGTGGMSHQLTGKHFGDMQRDNDLDFLDRIENDPQSLTGLTHQTLMERFGVEGIELIMWLVMRGALSNQVKRVHRHYYAPMTTGMGLITLEETV